MEDLVDNLDNWFKIKCVKCDNDIAKGGTIAEMLEDFFKQLSRHKHHSDNELCADAKDKIDFMDVEKSLKKEDFKVMVPNGVELYATGWVEADGLLGGTKKPQNQ